MSQDAEKVKRLVEFKKKLEEKIGAAESELKEMQAMLETLNALLLEKGFKRAEITKAQSQAGSQPAAEEEVSAAEPPGSQQSQEYQEAVPLSTTAGELLATLYVGEDSLRVVLAEDKSFSVDTPPFMPFLVERVFVKMQERDNELVRAGQLESDRIFCYNLIRDGDIIREILVKNIDPDRLRELKSSIRWTLEKMYEKTGK